MIKKSSPDRFQETKLLVFCLTGIKPCIEFWCDKNGVTALPFSNWKKGVISALDEKISHHFSEVTTEKCKDTLKLRYKIIA